VPLEHAIAYVKASAPTSTALTGTNPVDLTSSSPPPRAVRASKSASQPQTTQKRRQKTVPGRPRGNAPRLRPSIRRNLSQHELQQSPPPQEAPAPLEERARRRVILAGRGKRPSLLLAKERAQVGSTASNPLPEHSGEPSTASQSRNRVEPGKGSRKRTAESDIGPEPPKKITRSGRRVRTPARMRD